MLLVLALPHGARAAALGPGDHPAHVMLGKRPISDPSAAFTRGQTLYVSTDTFAKIASGAVSRDGNHYTVLLFPGTESQRKILFTANSAAATVDGKAVAMSAKAVIAYGHLYIPVSFFGSGALRTKVKVADDNLSATVRLPPDMR